MYNLILKVKVGASRFYPTIAYYSASYRPSYSLPHIDLEFAGLILLGGFSKKAYGAGFEPAMGFLTVS